MSSATWRTLAIFCTYRVVLSLLAGVAFLYFNRFFNLGVVSPAMVLPTIVTYAVASLVLLGPARLREPSLSVQVTAGVVVDVVCIVLLMYASGGIRSGLGVMLLISLTGAAIVAPRRRSARSGRPARAGPPTPPSPRGSRPGGRA